ncbi:MAG: signal peptidase I [Pseudorhodobacter sp.]|nr:MAG: signal peptidase I [Pseudorhodobacter sp.]
MPLFEALFDLNGTRTRKQALRVFLVLLGLYAGYLLIEKHAPFQTRFVAPLVGLAYVWWWATLVRRFHDAGRSGGWTVLLLVPGANLVVSLAGLVLRQGRPFNDSNAGLRLAGTLVLVAYALLSLSRLFWAPYAIPAESMKPTLLVGDQIVMRYQSAGSLTRGDVVVFRHPVNGVPMVKRLIGLPGDVVQMRAGRVLLNGADLVQADAGMFSEPFQPQGPYGNLPRCLNAVVGVGGTCDKALTTETQGDGRSYRIASIETGGPFDDTPPFTVPAGHFFFLGDNRDNSNDSRIAQTAGGLGFVAVENVIGQVSRVMISSAGKSPWQVWDWRGERMFKAVE